MSLGCSFLGGTVVTVGVVCFYAKQRTVEAGNGEDQLGHF